MSCASLTSTFASHTFMLDGRTALMTRGFSWSASTIPPLFSPCRSKTTFTWFTRPTDATRAFYPHIAMSDTICKISRYGRPRLKNAVELFNYRHSLLRSAVQRIFEVWKARFPIFDNMHPYPIENRRLFVVACCAVHNFIRKDCGADDPLFRVALKKHYGQDWIDVTQLPTMTLVPYVAHGQPPNRTPKARK